MKEQLKKAKAIIEGYDGPAVRVWKCVEHIPMRFFILVCERFCRRRWN